jgi:hypothetical protein
MLVRGFPKFNRMGRRDSLWNILNEESPSSAARRGRGPLKKLALKLAGDPAEEPTWTNGKFLEVLVILCIVLNTLILAIQHPSNTYPDEFNNFMNVMDLVLTSIFTAEMFIKIMAYGLYKGTPELPSYLSDGWNRLDFVVVIISWVSVLVEALELELPIKVSTLRALRIMRVLKSLRFFTGIKMILVTLARAAASMGTIVGFLAFVFTIAGIVGIQMFRGTVNWRCSKVAPTPDVSGLDWISLGIGDVTYRKHCVPDLEFPRCPEFPPCNVAYDRFTLEPIVDTLDNGVTWGEQIFETSGSRKRGWIRRSEGWRENATGTMLQKVYDNPQWYKSDNSGWSCTGTATNAAHVCDYSVDTNPELGADICPPGCTEQQVPTYTTAGAVGDKEAGFTHRTLADLTKVAWAPYGEVVASSLVALNRSQISGSMQAPNTAGGGDVQGEYVGEDAYVLRCPPCYEPLEDVCAVDEFCYEYGNPGFGYHGFDNIVMSWLTIFIEMANLYWWETGFRTQDTGLGLSATIAYDFGFIIVFVLSMVSVNMFVAVITDTFGSVRAEEDLYDFIEKRVMVKMTLVCKNMPKSNGRMVYVNMSGNDTIGDVKAKFQRLYLEQSLLDRHLLAYEDESVNQAQRDMKVQEWASMLDTPKDLPDDQQLAKTMAEQHTEEGPRDDPQLVRDMEIQHPERGSEVWEPDKLTRCKRPGGTTVFQMWIDLKPLDETMLWHPEHNKYEGGVDEDGNQKIVEVKRLLELHHPPPCYRVKWCSNLVTKSSFDSFIMTFILFNTLTLASEHFMQPESFTTILGNVGHIFNVVFTFEMTSKMLGMGVKNYLAIPFNRLDCFIVITSLLNYLGDVLPGASVARLLRVFRLFRVARVIRILYKYESMKRLLNTVMGSGVALLNLTLFILFSVTIFAIFGMHLFGGAYPTEQCIETVTQYVPKQPSVAMDSEACAAADISPDDVMISEKNCLAVMTAANPTVSACTYITELPLPRRSFEHFGVAWLMAFQTLTGDDWCNQMYQTMNVAGPVLPAMVYGMTFICCNYILTNLFIAVILENFEVAEKTKLKKQKLKECGEERQHFIEELAKRAETEWTTEMKDHNNTQVLVEGKAGKLKFNPATKQMTCTYNLTGETEVIDYAKLDGDTGYIQAAEDEERKALNGNGVQTKGRGFGANAAFNALKRLRAKSKVVKKKEVVEDDNKGKGCESCLCRNPILFCCRGCRWKKDCGKKTRRELQDALDNPEDVTKFACHDPNKRCAISLDNDVSLFLFHGQTETYFKEVKDMFGDVETVYDTRYTHPVRGIFQMIEKNPWFERTVMCAILVSSILLAYEGPAESLAGLELYDGYEIQELLTLLDTCFYGVFMFEFVTKLIHRGFIFTPNAYLSDTWNRLDFVVVMFSTMNYMPGQEKSSLGRVFRLGRCLRPLRMVNKNPGLKVIVTAVMKSLGTNLGVMALAMMLFLIFGILGCNLFGGKFWSCTCGDQVGEEIWKATCKTCMADRYPEICADAESCPLDSWKDVPYTKDKFDADPLWMSESADDEQYCVHACDDSWYRLTDGTHSQYKPVELCESKTFFQMSATGGACGEWMLGENDRIICEASNYYDDMIGEQRPCEWVPKRYNFDNIGQAFMGMFTAATLAGWTDIMEAAIDANGIDQQPVAMAAPAAAVYWVLFVFLNAFFITNLFVGVLVDYIAQSDGSALQTEEQAKWTDMKRLIGELRPDIEPPIPPKDPIRRLSLNVVVSSTWMNTSNACIVLNVIVMCLEFEYQPLWYGATMEYLNNAFLVFFTIEMILKLVGMGPQRYWMDKWNRFDATVVTTSWLGMWLGIQVQVARAFRAFRIVLVLKNAKGLQALFKCLIWAIVPSMNIGMLLGLHFSLFAILGMQILGMPSGPHFDEVPNIFPGSLGGTVGQHQGYLLGELGQTQQTMQTNFKSYWGAMKLLFECATGKDWKIVMYEVYDIVPEFSFLYFFFHFFFCVYILCNLFVAVIIDTFNSAGRELPVTPEHMAVFQNCWKAHAITEREKLDNASAKSGGKLVLEAMGEQDMFIRMREKEKIEAPIGSDEYMEEKWASLIALLKDVGRFKGDSDNLQRQRVLEEKVGHINDLIYEGKVEEAKMLMDELNLEENRKLLTSTLSHNISLW